MEPTQLSFQQLQDITDGFSTERKLGADGFAEFYKGDVLNGQEVAVKLFYNSLPPGVVDLTFENQIHILHKLNHRRIVKLIGYCYETQHQLIEYHGKSVFAQQIYRALCLEYAHNGSLWNHLSGICDGQLDWHTCFRIIKGVCEGLKYLHKEVKEPIYHLNLTPDSILLDINMDPKLACFDWSKIFSEERTQQVTNCIGKCGYMPPEYIEKGIVSEKFDIFSLGAVMIETILGSIDHYMAYEMPRKELIDLVHDRWRVKLKEKWSDYSLLEAYLQQIKRCTEIALNCLEVDRKNRPNIVDIVCELSELETVAYKRGDKKQEEAETWHTAVVDVGELRIRNMSTCIDKNEDPPYSAPLGAMGSLLGRLGNLLSDSCEVGNILQLRDDVRSIRDMLKKLSEVNEPPLTANYWMKHARELSYDMDDYFEDSYAKKEYYLDNSSAKKNDYLDDSDDKISGFRTRVMGMIERYKRFNLHSVLNGATATTTLVSHRPSRDDHVVLVGMPNRIQNLRSMLERKGDDKYDNQMKIASILGVEGVGKSTLVKKIWRESEYEESFECRAFVWTAKKPDVREILRSILSQVRQQEPAEDSGVPNLIEDITKHLQDKRYFIIIEDLRELSVWDVIRRAFPDCSVGSRIITTTADKDVALACCSYDPEHNYIVEPLSVGDSKELFIRTVVGSGKWNPQLSDDVSVEIERKCGGLPLAIIWTAILVANQSQTKQKLCQLEAEHELCKSGKELNLDSDVKNFLENNLRTCSTPGEILSQVLNLCYKNLPHCLKTCLLYLSIYPENYMILKRDLVNLWVVEGFICTAKREDNIEVAGSYFDILVSLGLIQRIDISSKKLHHLGEVVEEDGKEDPDRLPYAVHPMVFDFITQKSMEDNFITMIDYSEPVALKDKIRRLSLHFGSATYGTTPASIGLSQVRTLSFMGLSSCMPSLMEFKLVRVVILHLWADDRDKKFPLADICKLLLLRYLQVRCNVTVQLPGKMGCLKYLETLEINSEVTAVPQDIFHLPRLVHVRLGGKTFPTTCPVTSVNPILSDKRTIRIRGIPPPVTVMERVCGTTQFSNLPEDRPSIPHYSGLTKFSLSEVRKATNNFSHENEIERGCFGAVFKGLLLDGQEAAIKGFLNYVQLLADKPYRELHYHYKFHHKNIVKCLGFVDEESLFFLVLEYMPNGDMREINCGTRADWSCRLQLIQGIAQGLHYIHEQHVVHLDLKPSNVLLDSDKNAKITDFGISRTFVGDTTVIVTKEIIGTKGYIAPEYVAQGVITLKCDVYSFGVIFLETICGMCKGEPPKATASVQWARKVRHTKEMKESFDPTLYDVSQLKGIKRCMEIGLRCAAMEPIQRPTMKEVVLELHSIDGIQGNILAPIMGEVATK